MHLRPLLVGAMSVVATCAVTLGFGAAPAAADSPITIVNHNVAKNWDAIQMTVSKAVEIGAQGITMQEVCVSQANEMDLYWVGRWTVNWSLSRAESKGCGNDAVGTLAIWTGGPNGVDEDLKLPADEGRTPHLTCVRYGTRPVRHVCSTHLVAWDDDGVRPKQVRAVHGYTNAWLSVGHSVVVGGDFNTTPMNAALDWMYAQGGMGQFTEANMIEEPGVGTRDGNLVTAGNRKIDYVFFSRNRTVETGAGGLQLFTTPSDHKMMVARATMRY